MILEFSYIHGLCLIALNSLIQTFLRGSKNYVKFERALKITFEYFRIFRESFKVIAECTIT